MMRDEAVKVTWPRGERDDEGDDGGKQRRRRGGEEDEVKEARRTVNVTWRCHCRFRIAAG